jgi:hypothetical protein
MKALVLVAALFSTSLAFAENSIGTEEVIAAGGLTTIVGGCANARIVGSGENTEIIYTGPCQYAPTSERAHLASDYYTLFATAEEAAARCNVKDEVTASLDWSFQVRGWVCRELAQSAGGDQ